MCSREVIVWQNISRDLASWAWQRVERRCCSSKYLGQDPTKILELFFIFPFSRTTLEDFSVWNKKLYLGLLQRALRRRFPRLQGLQSCNRPQQKAVSRRKWSSGHATLSGKLLQSLKFSTTSWKICSRLDQQQQQLVRPAARTSYKVIINADDQTHKPFWSSAGMSFRPELSSSWLLLLLLQALDYDPVTYK